MKYLVWTACLAFVVLLAGIVGCQKQNGDSSASKSRVTILAAASLRECLDEMVAECGLASAAEFDISTGASSSLAQQIQSGANADLFLSANGEWAKAITDQFPEAEKKVVAGNTLVLVSPPGSSTELETLAAWFENPKLRLGIAGPEVPAGKYARQALASAGVLDGLVQNNRLIIGQDVRQVLRWVELDEVDAGIVYRTDVEVASTVTVVLDIDSKSHDPVEYWLVLLNREGASAEPARKMYDWFSSEAAARILERQGFLLSTDSD